jgi:hypothetical protein
MFQALHEWQQRHGLSSEGLFTCMFILRHRQVHRMVSAGALYQNALHINKRIKTVRQLCYIDHDGDGYLTKEEVCSGLCRIAGVQHVC